MKGKCAMPRVGVRATLLVSTLAPTFGCDDNTLILLGLDRPASSVPEAGTEQDTGDGEVVDGGDATGPDRNVDVSGVDGSDSGADAGGGDAWPFGPPTPVNELAASSGEDYKPTLTADMLEIYFLSNRPGGPGGGGDVWRAIRANPGDPWGQPGCVLEVSSPNHETSPAVSGDGLTLWVSSDRPGGKGDLDIWVSSRADRKAAWSSPTEVAELSSSAADIPRPPGQFGLVMPLAMAPISTDASQPYYHTYTASRLTIGGLWTAPSPLSSVDTANTDTDGFLTDDGLSFYFSSDRNSPGHQRMFAATRTDLRSSFASFTYLRELTGSGLQDRDPWLSLDGHQMYFSSDRSGTLKIYRAVR
jgi:hypothetical protein